MAMTHNHIPSSYISLCVGEKSAEIMILSVYLFGDKAGIDIKKKRVLCSMN